jgi:hypothetical protein
MRGSKSIADPKYLEAFTELLKRLVKNAGIDPRAPVDIYLAGGSALQFHTGTRMSDDVDAAFSRRIFVPEGEVIFTDSTGKARSIYWDRNYNESFALVHENAHQDAVRMPLREVHQARVWFFSPLDLAVSKLSRFSPVDRSDIVELARVCGVTSAALRKRAEEALSYYVGNPEPVRTAIKIACADIDAAVAPSTSKPRKP